MRSISVTTEDKKLFNKAVNHPLQSFGWGNFREKLGTKVIRRGFKKGNILESAFQLTIHHIPKTRWTIGYLPKGNFPTKELINNLRQIAKEENCIFIQLEPNIEKTEDSINTLKKLGLQASFHPLFTAYSFVLDLTKTEGELMESFHRKTRYNIRVAQRHGVTIKEDNSDKAYSAYLELMEETTKRQHFYAHNRQYHQTLWETLGPSGKRTIDDVKAHLFLAKYNNTLLVAWMLFVFGDTLYYPYGASSSIHRETMASNLMMWEAIRFGKKLGLKKFDMWGALGPDPNPHDPWYGFHRFKQGYNPRLVEFVGSFDLVTNPLLYQAYKVADRVRWSILKMKQLL